MSQVTIRKALDKKLTALGAFATVHENEVYAPITGTPYQESYLLPANPDNSTLGQSHYLEIGIFQVSLKYPPGKGPVEAQARAEAIKAHFKRGTTLVESGVQVLITETPAIAAGFMSGDRYVVPVSITYQADIFI